ncbi:MAG: hypothetical protein GY714_20965 [Desulfobacterales bacterium]|nr:hypothetical protein [Desulfobacterales bacterium]
MAFGLLTDNGTLTIGYQKISDLITISTEMESKVEHIEIQNIGTAGAATGYIEVEFTASGGSTPTTAGKKVTYLSDWHDNIFISDTDIWVRAETANTVAKIVGRPIRRKGVRSAD